MKNLFLFALASTIISSCKKEELYNPDQHITYTHWYKLDGRSSTDTLFSVWIPNAFTPNGDGKNDGFVPKGNCFLTNFCICDRLNHQIFKTTTWGEAWDGRNNNGEEVIQNGTYTYHLKIRSIPGGEFEYTGSVMLYR